MAIERVEANVCLTAGEPAIERLTVIIQNAIVFNKPLRKRKY